MKTRSILAIFFALALIGCAEGAKLVQERADGGVVIYPFKGEQGAILASSRKDAIALMQEKCGGLYNIVREGRQKDEPVWQAMSKGRRKLFKSADGALSFAVNKKSRRLVKRFVQQGHSERRAESYLDGTLRV